MSASQAWQPPALPSLDRNLASLAPRPQDWLWNGMVPRGTLTLAGGKGGGGKSTLLTHLAARITRGELPGVFQGQPANVLYLTQEDSIDGTLLPRLMVAGADLTRVHAEDKAYRFPADADKLLRRLERDHVKLLVIDPLMAYFHKLTTYGKSMQQLGAFIAGCAKRDVTVVAITHVTKASKKPDPNSFFGSAGLGTTVRQALMVGELGESRVVGVVKSNIGAKGHGWVYDMTENPLEEYPDITAPSVTLVRPARQQEVASMFNDEAPEEDRVLFLLELLARVDVMDSRDVQCKLCEEFAVKDRTARNVIGEAVSRYLVERTCEGRRENMRWMLALSESGRMLLEEGS